MKKNILRIPGLPGCSSRYNAAISNIIGMTSLAHVIMKPLMTMRPLVLFLLASRAASAASACGASPPGLAETTVSNFF